MKVVLVLVAVLATSYNGNVEESGCTTVPVALAEQCQDNKDCTDHGITSCSSGFNVVCHNNQCQCTHGPTGTMCVSQSDCTCDHGIAHCVDGRCHCGRHN